MVYNKLEGEKQKKQNSPSWLEEHFNSAVAFQREKMMKHLHTCFATCLKHAPCQFTASQQGIQGICLIVINIFLADEFLAQERIWLWSILNSFTHLDSNPVVDQKFPQSAPFDLVEGYL